jgi:hypothetical protein
MKISTSGQILPAGVKWACVLLAGAIPRYF